MRVSSSIIHIVNALIAPVVVLVADDEPTMLELVVRHLRSMEHPKLEVIDANDGDEAWRLARERLPDVVVLDVMMPGMSGWAVCRKIRQEAALAHTGVLMLTGIGDRLNETTSPLFGADEYIDKPFDFSDFDEKLLSVLAKHAMQREAVRRPRSESDAAPRDEHPDAEHAPPDGKVSRSIKSKKGLPKVRRVNRRDSTPKRDEPKRSSKRGEREKEKKKMASKKRAAKGVKRTATSTKRAAAKAPVKAAKAPARGVKSTKRSAKVVGKATKAVKATKATKAVKAPKRAKAKKAAKKAKK